MRAELGTSTIKDTVNEALNLIVLHYDSDFDSISAVTGHNASGSSLQDPLTDDQLGSGVTCCGLRPSRQPA